VVARLPARLGPGLGVAVVELSCGFPPLSQAAVAEHVAQCPRCQANALEAAERGQAWERSQVLAVREREAQIHTDRDRRAAAWPVERFRALMAAARG
jgi:hypothetical protein